MRKDSVTFIEDQRRHLKTIPAGYVRMLNLPALRQVMWEEIDPNYPLVGEEGAEAIFQMIRDLISGYDARLLNGEGITTTSNFPLRESAMLTGLQFLDGTEKD